MIQNMLIPLVEEVLLLVEKIVEDNRAAWVTVTQMPTLLYGVV